MSHACRVTFRCTVCFFIRVNLCFSYGIGLVLDCIAMAYESQSSIPLSSMAILAVVWILLAFPLTIVGTVLGRHGKISCFASSHPCKVNSMPRPIPQHRWYMSRALHM